jgi:hypothetical protein
MTSGFAADFGTLIIKLQIYAYLSMLYLSLHMLRISKV